MFFKPKFIRIVEDMEERPVYIPRDIVVEVTERIDNGLFIYTLITCIKNEKNIYYSTKERMESLIKRI